MYLCAEWPMPKRNQWVKNQIRRQRLSLAALRQITKDQRMSTILTSPSAAKFSYCKVADQLLSTKLCTFFTWSAPAPTS